MYTYTHTCIHAASYTHIPPTLLQYIETAINMLIANSCTHMYTHTHTHTVLMQLTEGTKEKEKNHLKKLGRVNDSQSHRVFAGRML